MIAGARLREAAPDVGVGPDTLRVWVVNSPTAFAAARAAGYADAGEWLTARGVVSADQRRSAVEAVLGGQSKAEVARRYGVSDTAVRKWVRHAQRDQGRA